MGIMKFKIQKIVESNYFALGLVFLISIVVNQYYGFIGVNPIDNFTIYHSGNLILEGKKPFQDFWVTTGLLLDTLQFLFFKFFGVSWSIYVFHASLINATYCLSVYLILYSFKLKKRYCFFYSILSAIIFYPTVGTPFVDHHAVFFSMLALFCFILSVKTNKSIYWFFIPIFLILGFFSKQTPTSYIAILIAVLGLYNYLINKNHKVIFIGVFSIFISFTIIIYLFYLNEISITNFYQQYIQFASSVGQERIASGEFINPISFSRYIVKFKYIHLSYIPLLLIFFKNVLNIKFFYKHEDFLIALTLIFSAYCFIIHQLLTLNSKYIYFLIPLLGAFSHIYIEKYKFKNKIYFKYLLMAIVLVSSFYYFYKYVHQRGFILAGLHLDQKKIYKTDILDKKGKSFNWITPSPYGYDTDQEIKDLISSVKKIKSFEKNSSEKYLLITDYQFIIYKFGLSNAISINKLYGEGISYPSIKNKNFENYKFFFNNRMEENNIKKIYFITPSWFNEHNYALNGILNDSCIKKIKESTLIFYKVHKC